MTPNPASEYVVVSVDGNTNDEIVIRLYNENGSLLLTRNQKAVAGKNNIRINDLGKLVKGIYLVQITAGAKTTTEKLIVQ